MDFRDINWNQVYSFYEIAKSLSMTQGAKRLGVSVPTVSEQIKRLEKSLKVELFKRRGRYIELSDDGFALFECAREMFSVGHKLIAALQPACLGGQIARVGVPETGLLIGMNLVSAYWDIFAPYGTVTTVRELLSSQLIERIVRQEIDWAIVLSKPNMASIDSIEIGEFEVNFCCSSMIYERFRHPEQIVRSLPFVRTTWDQELNEIVDMRLRDAGIHSRELVTTDHREFCINLIQRSRAVGTLSSWTIANQAGISSLIGFTIGEPIKIRLHAAWSKSKTKSIIIRKLHELTNQIDLNASDPELQLRVSDIPKDWLRHQDLHSS